MRKLKIFITVLCICLLCVPMTVQASGIREGKEVKSDFFTVDFKIGEHDCIGPGDSFSDTLEIKNTTDQEIKVRVYDVDNVKDSKLYSVLLAGWNEGDGKEVKLDSFDKLTPTDWYTLKKGQTLELKLNMEFPLDCGNEYEGATLHARFTIESRIPMEAVWKEDIKADSNIPKTGDDFNVLLWGGILLSSGCAIVILLVLKKKRKNRQT